MGRALDLSYSLALCWSFAAFIGLRLILLLTSLLWPESALDIVHLGASEALTFVLFAFLVLRVHAPERSLSDAVGLRATHPGLLVLGLGLGLCLRFPADAVRHWVEQLFPTPEEVLLAQAALLDADGLPQVIKLLLVLAIVGPLVEELFYRGALYGPLLRHRGSFGAVAFTAVVFVVAHAQWRDYPALLLVALVMGYLRAASGSLLPCLALHVGFNTGAVVALASGAATVTEPLEVPLWLNTFGWLAVIALSWLVYRIAGTSAEAALARKEDES